MRPPNVSARNSPSERETTPPRTNDQRPDMDSFEIILTYDGHAHRHLVQRHMFVSQLAEESATIFHLHEQDLILMLFGMIPHFQHPTT
jgi:hypothetical protein